MIPALAPLMSGDLQGAVEGYAPLVERALPHITSEAYLSWIVGGELLILEEMGDVVHAADVADDFMRRRSGLTPDGWPWVRAFVLVAQRRAQRISDADYRKSRDAFMAEAMASEGPFAAWLDFYPAVVRDAPAAREALASMPEGSATPSLLQGDSFNATMLGRTYLLAGRIDDAIPLLRHAAASCISPDGSILFRTWANEGLGEALEQKGDEDGACAAYGRVLARWGHAKPRSVTADAARAHAKKLGCPSQLPR
jgi:serine/threonine-protein kinase